MAFESGNADILRSADVFPRRTEPLTLAHCEGADWVTEALINSEAQLAGRLTRFGYAGIGLSVETLRALILDVAPLAELRVEIGDLEPWVGSPVARTLRTFELRLDGPGLYEDRASEPDEVEPVYALPEFLGQDDLAGLTELSLIGVDLGDLGLDWLAGALWFATLSPCASIAAGSTAIASQRPAHPRGRPIAPARPVG